MDSLTGELEDDLSSLLVESQRIEERGQVSWVSLHCQLWTGVQSQEFPQHWLGCSPCGHSGRCCMEYLIKIAPTISAAITTTHNTMCAFLPYSVYIHR